MQMKKNLWIGLEVVTTGCLSTASPLAWLWHCGLSPLSGVAAGPAVASWASPSMARTEAGGGIDSGRLTQPLVVRSLDDRPPLQLIANGGQESRRLDFAPTD
jgi:hypothetical protein